MLGFLRTMKMAVDTTKIPRVTLCLGGLAIAYVFLSVWCFTTDNVTLPNSGSVGAVLLGPPAMLLWKSVAFSWFSIFTVAFGLCVACVIFIPSRRILFGLAAIALWIIGGFLAYAVSI
jgi:hypothetical protein